MTAGTHCEAVKRDENLAQPRDAGEDGRNNENSIVEIPPSGLKWSRWKVQEGNSRINIYSTYVVFRSCFQTPRVFSSPSSLAARALLPRWKLLSREKTALLLLCYIPWVRVSRSEECLDIKWYMKRNDRLTVTRFASLPVVECFALWCI